MALTRFNGNVVPFASESTTDNRTVFGDVVQADDIDSNLNADFKKGWEIVGLNDNPTKQDFNAMGYTLGALTSYLYQMGIAEYNVSQEYKLNAVCIGTDGTIYQSLVDANIGNALNDVSKWKNVTESYVTLTGDQTIAGIKTFVKSPIVPDATTTTQAVNKGQLDTKQNTLISGTNIKTINSTSLLGSGNISITETAWVPNDNRAKTALNASGTAPIYACRAWVNFNGTGTVAIRASGNVSSIADNGTGDYTVNFSTAMPDANYSANTTVGGSSGQTCTSHISDHTLPTISSISIYTRVSSGSAYDILYEFAQVNVSIFR